MGQKDFKRNEQITRNCQKLFSPRQFYTIFEQTCLNLKPFLSNTFPQGFRISKQFGHWTLGSWGKKTVQQSEQIEKIRKNFFAAVILNRFGAKKFKSETPSFQYFSPRILNT